MARADSAWHSSCFACAICSFAIEQKRIHSLLYQNLCQEMEVFSSLLHLIGSLTELPRATGQCISETLRVTLEAMPSLVSATGTSHASTPSIKKTLSASPRHQHSPLELFTILVTSFETRERVPPPTPGRPLFVRFLYFAYFSAHSTPAYQIVCARGPFIG